MANKTGLSKARGHKKGQKRFWPVAAWQDWQKLAGWLQQASPAASLSLSLCRARAHCCAHSAFHLSTTLLCTTLLCTAVRARTAEREGERGCCSSPSV